MINSDATYSQNAVRGAPITFFSGAKLRKLKGFREMGTHFFARKTCRIELNAYLCHAFFTFNINIMYLDAAKKQEIFAKYGKSNTDTGSAEAQIALFSYRISHLTEHLKLNRKDYSTSRALTKLVGKRRALLTYLAERDINRYRAIVKELGLRK